MTMAENGARTTRTLVLLRHAKAEPGGAGADITRTLAPRGRAQGPGVAAALLAAGAVPQVVLCSAAVRTRQTWQVVATALADSGVAVDAIDVRFLDDLYEASPGTVIEHVGVVADSVDRVLVVGHEPTMSVTTSRLADAATPGHLLLQVSVGIPTAAACVLELSGHWSDLSSGSATLRGVLRPAE